MIGTYEIKVNAAKPNFPLQPMFAFMGSPSSLRILEVPKKIGDWNITSVRVVAQYPDNTTIEKVAVRTGAVWVATFDGCDVAGKVGNGLSILADGIDEDGNEVTGYVLGKGDLFILENDTEIARLVEKHTVVYMDELPSTPSVGDLVNSNGEFRIFDGENWIEIGGGGDVNDSQITINKNGQIVGAFTTNSEVPVSINIPVPSRTSDVVNDSGFITVDAIPSTISSFENDVGYITEAAIPSNVTAFNNDAGYITQEAIPSEISAFENDVGYITATAIPSQVSSFENDVGYITASALPTKVSELENDSGYITENAIPSTVGAFQNDVGYLTSVSWGEVQNKPDVALMSDIPSKVSELDNDEGFITAEALPSKVSELENDVGYLSAVSWDIVTDKPAIPSTTSDLVNDSGFITESAIPSNVSAFNNDVGYLTTSSSAFTAKRDKTDLVYKVGFDKNNLDKVVKFVVEYVDGNNQNATATLDKYDKFTQTWTGDNTNWRVYTYLVGMESELYFALDDGTAGQDAKPAPSQGVEDTSWNFTYNSNPATWTMVMTQNIALQQDFKNLRNMKDISYPASVDSTGMYTIQKFNVNGTEVAHFTASGSTSTWDTNDPVMNQYEISTTDGTNFTLVSNGIQLGTFTMTNLKNGVVDVTYDGSTYTVGAVFKQTTFALKDYVDAQATSIPSATSDLVNDSGFITASAIPSNVGAFTNDAGYLTADSTTIQNLQNNDTNHEWRIREVEKQATGARDWMDLSYPTVNANAQDGFGIHGFTVDFPSYGNQPSTSNYMRFYSVVSGAAIWKTASGNLEMKTSDGIHFSYFNNNGWMDFPLNNTSPTEAWTHYFAQGIRPAYITASFKSNTMKKIALEDYVDASLAEKRGIHDNAIHPTSVTNTPFYKVRVEYTDIS